MTPVQVINSVYDAFKCGEIPHILSQVAPGATWRQSKMLPWGGEYQGPDGAAEFFTRLDDKMETLVFEPKENIEVGEEVFSFGYYEGRSRKTGKTGGANWMFRWRVSGGKIVMYDSHIDTAALLQAMA